MTDVMISRVYSSGRYGMSSSSGVRCWLSPGIHDPLCGWPWLTGRAHPEVELSFELVRPGSRFSARLNPGARPGLAAELARASRGSR